MNASVHEEPAADLDELRHFRDVEAIKQLKARYCRYLDMKDWAAWRGLFTDDFVGDTSEVGGRLVTGADAFVQFLIATLGKPARITVHQVHAPEIELTSLTTARGCWALQDVVALAPGLHMVGYGHYHETYEKTDGRWYIKTSKLTRLREDLHTPIVSVRIPARLRDAAGAAAARRSVR
ncbi:nuclear transport factor 2 family protein [Nocardia sp. N2S4-5]|uniref:nuclear transport factor 2 family protein n=1 Tax=Nocardia sp. N2S4-5 TaxID=3351565 RepID=UPI0037D1E618